MSEYTILRAAEAPDYTGEAPGAFLGYGRPIGSDQIAFNVRVLAPGMVNVPPGQDPTTGHSHDTVEEIYFVLEGALTVKVGDDVETLGPRDAILIPRGMARMTRNDGEDEAAIAMVSVRMEDPVADTQWHEGFWPQG
jgi:mannose-6-phosphate isomerase-like protein (cupin superfamily)